MRPLPLASQKLVAWLRQGFAYRATDPCLVFSKAKHFLFCLSYFWVSSCAQETKNLLRCNNLHKTPLSLPSGAVSTQTITTTTLAASTTIPFSSYRGPDQRVTNDDDDDDVASSPAATATAGATATAPISQIPLFLPSIRDECLVSTSCGKPQTPQPQTLNPKP